MSDNVINMFDRKNKNSSEAEVEKKEESSFDEIVRRNKENELRLKKEREKANKSVIRSYRLKH